MISYEVFQKNRSEYGQCCSWAVWDIGAPEYSRYAPDTTLPTFYLNRAVKKLNAISSAENLSNLGWTLTPDVVIVALNFAERDVSAKKATQNINFHSFHEETAATSDYRLRDICLGTPLWGAYLTDLAKFEGTRLTPIRDSTAINIERALRDENFRNNQVSGLTRELQALGSQNPTIIALGNAVYKTLQRPDAVAQIKDSLGEDTQIVKVTHYSKAAGIRHSDYVARVYEELRPIKFSASTH